MCKCNYEDQRKMSTSMYEVFNWGHLNDSRPKRYSLAIAGSHIDIDEPPTAAATASHRNSNHVYNKIGERLFYLLTINIFFCYNFSFNISASYFCLIILFMLINNLILCTYSCLCKFIDYVHHYVM